MNIQDALAIGMKDNVAIRRTSWPLKTFVRYQSVGYSNLEWLDGIHRPRSLTLSINDIIADDWETYPEQMFFFLLSDSLSVVDILSSKV